jgi:uncharacterized protein (UPF0147 family)
MVVGMVEKAVDDNLLRVTDMLQEIVNDRTVPRNIRSAAESAIGSLNSKGSNELKVSTAVQTLDEIINDPNMPMYTRTQIWNVVSILEQLRER